MASSAPALYQPFPMLPRRRAQAWRHRPQYQRPRHFHDEPELNLVLRGRAELGVGSQRITLRAGEVALFLPGQDHELLAASSDLDLYVLALSADLASRAPARSPTPHETRLAASLLASVASRLDQVALAADTVSAHEQLVETFGLVRAYAKPPPPVARRARDLLEQEPGLACRAVAHTLRVHPSELTRAFQRAHGLSVIEYRTRLRLMKFIALVDGGQSFTQAALEADFGSYAQCFRIFQRLLRHSPREYFEGARQGVDDALASAPEVAPAPEEAPAANESSLTWPS